MVEEHFMAIKEVYDSFYKYLLVKRGMFPVKDTKDGYWGVSVSTDLFKLFNQIGLKNHNHILDLGSGDGKVVMIASLFTKATGIESDPWLFDVSNDIKNKLFHISSTNNARFLKDNYMNHDFSNYDVVFLNPDNKSERLNKKLKDEFNGKLIVYGPHYHPEGFNKETSYDIDGTPTTIYRN